jgi:hypothetical protein
MRRRLATYSLATDAVVALVLGLAISSALGWIVFLIGLVVTGFLYYTMTQVMKTRGYR